MRCSRPCRERRCSCWPPSRGVKLPTGAIPRRFGRIRSLAPSRMRWLITASLIPTPGREEPRRRSPISAKRWRSDSVDRVLICQMPWSPGGLFGLARENRRGAGALRGSGACLPSRPVFHARLAIALAQPTANSTEPSSSGARPCGWPPPFRPARLGLAKALLADGDAGEAADQCRQVLKQQPRAPDAIAILRSALAAQGKADDPLYARWRP